MYICVCQAVSDQDIRRAVAQGVDSFEALQARTGCTSCCGCCEQEARALFEANLGTGLTVATLPVAA